MLFSRRQLLGLFIGLGVGASVPPSSVAKRARLRIGAISDLNSSYGSTSYIESVHKGIRQLIALQPDLIVCAGDMVAGQKRGLNDDQLDAMWSGFNESIVQPLQIERIPFLPALGNHDASPDFPTDQEAVRRFWTPIRSQLGLQFLDASRFPFRYTVLQDGVFWLVWDASSAHISSEDVTWTRHQLKSSEAVKADVRFVVGHLPIVAVSKGKDRPGEVLSRWSSLKHLMVNSKVQAYISGHHHAWFSSRLDDLDLIQLGALGSGPRSLLHGGPHPQQTYTLLDIDLQRYSLTETTYVVSTGQQLSWTSVPTELVTRRGILRRNLPTRSLLG